MNLVDERHIPTVALISRNRLPMVKVMRTMIMKTVTVRLLTGIEIEVDAPCDPVSRPTRDMAGQHGKRPHSMLSRVV